MDRATGSWIRQIAKKLICIKYLGGNCAGCSCNLVDAPWLAQFHHRDPTSKLYQISYMLSSALGLYHLRNELDKCELLCQRCHTLRHFRVDLWGMYQAEIANAVGRFSFDDPKCLSQSQKQEITDLAVAGLSIQDITARTGISRHLIRTVIPLDSILRFGNDKRQKVTDEQIRLHMDAYSIREMADIFGMGYKTMWKRVRKVRDPTFNMKAS